MKDIFITRIKINKVRHLENIDIELSKAERKHVIFTGKNGSGKTSLLEAIVKRIDKLLLQIDLGRPGFDLRDNGKRIQAMKETFDNESFSLELNSSLADFDTRLARKDFILAFFEAKRLASMTPSEGPKKIHFKERYPVRGKEPASVFLQYLVNLRTEQSYARDDGDTETIEKIEKWFTIFKETLRDLFEDDTLQLQFDRKNFTFYFITKGRERFDFNTLSDGYSAAVSMLCDLIVRMERNGRPGGYDMQGIVLVDEIETHLHVELQKKILPLLTSFFPKIQFVVSTHSPFVLNSLDNAVVYDLENQIRVEDLSAYSYEAIVERYFDVDQYSDRIKMRMNEYETLLDKAIKTEEEHFRILELRNYFKKISSDFAPELVAHFQNLELQKVKNNGAD